MNLGAAFGGAAEGAGTGFGRLGNALMQVLGSQQHRAGMAEEKSYRRYRDGIADTANREAMDLQKRTLEARQHEMLRSDTRAMIESDRNFEQRLREGGFDYERSGAGPRLGTPGGTPSVSFGEVAPITPGVGTKLGRGFTVGDYNPEKDPALKRSIALKSATPPTMSVGGLTAPATPAGRTQIEDHMTWRSGLPGGSAPGRDPNRDRALVEGALTRMEGEDGQIGSAAPRFSASQVTGASRKPGLSHSSAKRSPRASAAASMRPPTPSAPNCSSTLPVSSGTTAPPPFLMPCANPRNGLERRSPRLSSGSAAMGAGA